MPLPPIAVPGRTCGACIECCRYPSIDTPEFRKSPSVECAHCNGQGCGIYKTRPKVCRDYFCGWRLAPFLDDSWRPDRVGMMMVITYQNIPPGYLPEGLQLLMTQPHIALAHPEFCEFLARGVRAKVPLFLCLAGPPGSHSAGKFLNARLHDAVTRDDAPAILATVETMLKEVVNGPFNPASYPYSDGRNYPL